jgi:hypothetical protein
VSDEGSANGFDGGAPPSAGVDGNYMAAPEQGGGAVAQPDFNRLYERMDQMSAQQQMLVDALSYAPDEDLDYEGMSSQELAEALGLSPEELAQAEAEGDFDPDVDDWEDVSHLEPYIQARGQQDILNLVESSVDRRLAEVDAQQDVEIRDVDFDTLRDQMPILQDEQTARAVIDQALQIASAWDPGVIETPQFVGLIELIAKSHIADRAINGERPAQPPQVQLESAHGSGRMTAPKQDASYWGDRILDAAHRLRPGI